MLDNYDTLFNSNIYMHIMFFIIGMSAIEIYNYFIECDYNIIYLIMCICILIGSFLWFYIQYKNYNKDV